MSFESLPSIPGTVNSEADFPLDNQHESVSIGGYTASEPDTLGYITDTEVDVAPVIYDIDSVSSVPVQPLPAANPDFFRNYINKDRFGNCNYLDERAKITFERVQERFKTAPKSVLRRAEEKKTLVERQLEESEKQLGELLRFGQVLITNIAVSNDKREVLRRDNETRNRKVLEKDLHMESVRSLSVYDGIMERWQQLADFKEPVTLYEEMEKQKERVAELMRSKDDIIAQCQKEIDRIDRKYVDEQQKQAAEMSCLVERIDSQVELIKLAYNEHLEMLANTILTERQNISLEAENRWQRFSNMMNEHEEHKFKIVQEKDKFYEQQIKRISIKQEEVTRATRIRLDKEAEMLECELRNTRNNAQINSEKLDYNYQILQKRNEENIIINNQQKRRVGKLQEDISALKKKIAASALTTEQTSRRVTAEIQKLHANITELEKKSLQFKLNNVQLFHKVWECNYNELQSLLKRVFEIDKIIYEQQLCASWTPIEIETLDMMHRRLTGRSTTANCARKPKHAAGATKVTKMETLENTRLLRNILRRIADRGGFLVEEKLLKILKPFSKDDKCLVRIHNIFEALQIDDMRVVASLTEFFKPYSYCPNCQLGLDENALQKLFQTKAGEKVLEPIAASSKKVERVPKCNDHYLIIEPSMVLTALNEFTQKQLEMRTLQTNTQEAADYSNELLSLDVDVIRSYWKKFATYMPEEKQKLWNLLEHGLNHYLDVLKQRLELEDSCIFLRKQNAELKHLLQEFDI